MGSGASTVDSSQLCLGCDTETHDIFNCIECKGKVCVNCCPHAARKRNYFYQKHPQVLQVSEIPNESHQKYKRIRGGCLVQGGKLVVLCCYYLEDGKCKCCDVTSQWKLIQVDGYKQLQISDRLHDTETERHPGQVVYSNRKHAIYMTAPVRKTIYTISSMDVYKAFETSGNCYGIACFDNGLAISVQIKSDYTLPTWQIQFVDFKGNVKKRVSCDLHSYSELFSNPRYLCSNSSENKLFVSDDEKRQITALDNNGNVLFQFRHEFIRNPRGITVDPGNNIYVANGQSVVQIEAGGREARKLLTKAASKDDIVDVLFSCANNTLLVIQSSGKIATFAFES